MLTIKKYDSKRPIILFEKRRDCLLFTLGGDVGPAVCAIYMTIDHKELAGREVLGCNQFVLETAAPLY